MSPFHRLVRAFARRFTIAFVVSVAFMVFAVVFVNYVIDSKFNSIEKKHLTQTTKSPTNVLNFLLIGSDTRAFVHDSSDAKSFGDQGEAGGQRSDTLMVVHVDPKHGKAVVVSFPRDLWVDIPGVGKSKINAAFNTGPDTVIQTLRDNFEIPINHYIEIDFKSFQGIVDAIGTVPIYFPYPSRDDQTGLYTPVAGCQQLDGKAALAYVRSRHLQYYSFSKSKWVDASAAADLARIKRQQDFMRRVAAEAVAHGLGNPITASDIVDNVLQNLTVDQGLTKEDLLALIDVFRHVNPGDESQVKFLTLPSYNGSAGSLSVLYVQTDQADPLLGVLRDFTGNLTSTVTSASTDSTSGSSTSSTTSGSSSSSSTANASASTTTQPTTPAPIANQSSLGAPAPDAAPC